MGGGRDARPVAGARPADPLGAVHGPDRPALGRHYDWGLTVPPSAGRWVYGYVITALSVYGVSRYDTRLGWLLAILVLLSVWVTRPESSARLTELTSKILGPPPAPRPSRPIN